MDRPPDEPAQPPQINLGGAQTGDVKIGDVAGGDLHKPNVAPGGIYAPGGMVNVTQALPVGQQALHQLRAPVADFVGRAAEIAALTAALTSGEAATISGLAGMGGIGKTELAMVVGHALLDRYPDAQIVLSLQGSRPSALAAAQALQNVIRAFMPDAQLPDDEPGLVAAFRSVLTGKRVLILADDAKDAAQVRPLLPPAGSALLITSRQRFSLPGMRRIDLERLGEAEAVALLGRLCERLRDDEARQIAAACGRLPLALRIAGGVLANDETLGAARYLQRLADERRRLAALRDPDDPDLDVAASIALSYDLLDPAAQATLCQLGVFVASFDLAAAGAVLAEGDPDTLADRLGPLYRRSLLEYEPALARYDLHELVRVFALGRLGDAERAARLRHAEHYIAVADQAEDLYLAGGENIDAGLALFDRERANLDAARRWLQAHAGDAEVDALLIAVAEVTTRIGTVRYGTAHERILQLQAALDAAVRLGRRSAQGWLSSNLGTAYNQVGAVAEAIDHYEQALSIARELGDRRGEYVALGNLSIAYRFVGNVRMVLAYCRKSLAIARELGDRRAEGTGLANLGVIYTHLGHPRKAIKFYRQALAIDHELGDRLSEASTLGNLGNAHYYLGEMPTAIKLHEQSLAIARELGDRWGEGRALGNLGNAYTELGDADRAIDYCQQHLAIARELGDRPGEGQTLGNLGNAYARIGKVKKAIELFTQHLDIARELGDSRGQAYAGWNLGQAYVRDGRVDAALPLLEARVAYEQAIGHPDAEGDAALVAYVRQHGRLPDEDGHKRSDEQGPSEGPARDIEDADGGASGG